ncbi:restriction endonuclease subunit S [Dermacoccus barathri]|uniref:Restriction endonuclease subunit S n=1 Tax=Dermacoccus barathri TaxID=322601 RepID=A0ABN2B156_9MICO
MSEVVQPVGFPERWRTAPLWTLFRRTSRKGHSAEPLLSVYRDFGVVPRGFTDDNWNRIPEDLSGYPLVRPGDLVLNKMKAWQGSLGVSTYRGIVSPAYFVFAPLRDDFSQSFLHYLLRSRPFIESYGRMSGGIRVDQWDLDPWAFSRLRLPLPPLPEQRAIADYLDRETAKIDTLAEKQTTMIERLRERRAAVVRGSVLGEVSANRAATPYWFGRIPSHWQTPRLSHHHHVVLGRTINASQALDTDISVPYVAAGSIQPEELILDAARTLTVPAADVAKYSLRRGDVVVVEGGAGYGRSHWLPTDIPGWAFQNHVVRVRPRDSTVDSRFTRLVIETCRQSGFFEANNRTATLPSLSSEVLGALRIPLPPLDEQRAIADYLDRGTAKIDTLIAKVQRHIELAKERRAALITAVVTGQIDVTTSTQSGDAA